MEEQVGTKPIFSKMRKISKNQKIKIEVEDDNI